jgi:hypothetical protein
MTRGAARGLAILVVAILGCGRHQAAQDSSVSAHGPLIVSDTLPAEPSVADASTLLRAYYDAINAKRYRDAYACWASQGEASRQTFDAFAAGFAHTASVAVQVGAPSPMGAAAGSRYIEIPARIVATMDTGAKETFSGTYTLRRSVVDGATPDQRQWRIYSAEIKRER